MSAQRLIIQMASAQAPAPDAHKAAMRAAKRALSQSDIAAHGLLGLTQDVIRVRLTVAVPEPTLVEKAPLLGLNKLGQTELRVVSGGLAVPDAETGRGSIVATAAVEVFLPKPDGWRLRS